MISNGIATVIESATHATATGPKKMVVDDPKHQPTKSLMSNRIRVLVVDEGAFRCWLKIII